MEVSEVKEGQPETRRPPEEKLPGRVKRCVMSKYIKYFFIFICFITLQTLFTNFMVQ